MGVILEVEGGGTVDLMHAGRPIKQTNDSLRKRGDSDHGF